MSAVGRVIDGKATTFKRATAKQVADLCELAYQYYRASYLEDKQAGEDVATGMDALRKIRGDLNLLWRYVWSMHGALAVLEVTNPGAVVDPMDVQSICKLAGEVCGFDMTPIESNDKNADGGDGFVRPQSQGSGTT